MTRHLLFLTLTLALVVLACGPLDSSVDEVEEVAPTLEEEFVASEDNSQENDLCTILTFEDFEEALGVEVVELSALTVGPDQASCSYAVDPTHVFFVRIDLTTSARSARTIYETGYVVSFGDGPAVEEIEGPWSDGFWNGDNKAVYAWLDDEVAFRIEYPPADDSSRDGLIQLTELFFERFP